MLKGLNAKRADGFTGAKGGNGGCKQAKVKVKANRMVEGRRSRVEGHGTKADFGAGGL